MENEQPQWLKDILSDHRHLQELQWNREDIEKMAKEELLHSIKQNHQQIEREKDLVLYNYKGQRIIQRQPFK